MIEGKISWTKNGAGSTRASNSSKKVTHFYASVAKEDIYQNEYNIVLLGVSISSLQTVGVRKLLMEEKIEKIDAFFYEILKEKDKAC